MASETYRVQTGNVDWQGVAESQDEAFRKAVSEGDDSTVLGRIVKIKRGKHAPLYHAMETIMERVGLSVAPEVDTKSSGPLSP